MNQELQRELSVKLRRHVQLKIPKLLPNSTTLGDKFNFVANMSDYCRTCCSWHKLWSLDNAVDSKKNF